MIGFRVLLAKELREQLRTYRLPVVAVVFVALGLGSPVLARYTPELIKSLGGAQVEELAGLFGTPTASDAIDQLMKNLGQIGILVSILLAMGSVAGEKASGTAALILTKPASRAAFLAAKLAAISITLGVATLLASGFGYAYTGLLFGTWLPAVGFAAMAFLLWVSLVFYAALTFLGSTLTRSAMAAAGIGIAFFVATGILSIIPVVGDYLPQSLEKPGRALALGLDPGAFAGPLAVSLGLIALLGLISWLSFRRQEL